MNPYEVIAKEREAKERAKADKIVSLERQLKVWKTRQKELRYAYSNALDPEFVRRQLDKCDNEIKKINDMLSVL